LIEFKSGLVGNYDGVELGFESIMATLTWEHNGTPGNNNGNPPETILNAAAPRARKAS